MPTHDISNPLGWLKVSGIDAKKLLQGQLTCDVDKLPPEGSLGAHCNPQGRIISLFWLFRIDPDYYLQMPQSLVAIALKALQKYAVFYQVTLSDVSEAPEMPFKPTDKYTDILSTIPAIYPETSEKFLPHDLNLPLLGAVSFDKGCYTGQEIIARMQYLGKSKNHLSRITLPLATHPIRGTDLEHYGQVVDYYQIDYTTYEILILTQAKK